MNFIANQRAVILAELKRRLNVGLLKLTKLPFHAYQDDVTAHTADAATRNLSEQTLRTMQVVVGERGWQLSRQAIAHPTIAGRTIEYMFLAPKHFVAFSIGFHATRRKHLSSILAHGLLPSNPERQNDLTRRDCDGNIYVCEQLGTPRDAGVTGSLSAHWWCDHFEKTNRFHDGDWIILRIDLAGLPCYRLYRDLWSASGVIVEGVDRIPPELISLVAE